MNEEMQMSLKTARTYAGLTQQEIAEKLNMDRNSYRRYEKYRIPMRIDTAVEFCKITGVEMDNVIFLPNNYTSSVVK